MRVGGYHVGLRSDDPGALDALRALYAPVTVDDDRAGDDYSVRMTGAAPGARLRPKPYVARGRCPRLRSESLPRLLRYVDLELASLITEPEPGTVSLRGMAALVADGRAALVPASLVERSSAVERALRDARVGVAEQLGLRLDPIAGEVVVPAGLIGHSLPAAMDDGLSVAPGRHRVVSVHWSRQGLDVDEHPSLGLIRLLTAAEDRTELKRGALLRGLAAMAPTYSPHRVDDRGTADLHVVVSALRS